MVTKKKDPKEALKAEIVNKIFAVKHSNTLAGIFDNIIDNKSAQSPPTIDYYLKKIKRRNRLLGPVTPPCPPAPSPELSDDEKLARDYRNYTIDELNEKLEKEERKKKAREETAKKEAELEEKRRSFDFPKYKADYKYCSELPYWTLEEGVLIMMEKEPREVMEKINLYPDSPFYKTYQDNLERAKRAVEVGELQDKNSPLIFIAWMGNKNLHVPDELRELVRKQSQPNIHSNDKEKEVVDKPIQNVGIVEQQGEQEKDPVDELQAIVSNIFSTIERGNKPENIREIVLKILDYAEGKVKFNKDAIPGTYKDLMNCVEKLLGQSLAIKPETFRSYVKGKLGKYNCNAICQVIGKLQHPWGSIFPDFYN